MREEDSSWFSKWEEELPSPDELMPLSQSLITPDLASAFDIRGGSGGGGGCGGVAGGGGGATSPALFQHHHQQHHQSSSSPQVYGGGHNHHHHHNYGGQQSSSTPQPPPTHPNSSEFDSSSAELGCGGGGAGSELEPARTLKRPRLVWTPQLHKRFVDAVAHLGIKNAVPKTIMQLMSVDGLTRENVASHLQKYRLYLKRMQGGGGGLSGGPGNGPGGLVGSGDPATDRLFASSPVPAHFLHQPTGGGAGVSAVGNGHVPGPGAVGVGPRPNSDHFMSYMPVAALHHQQIQAQYRQMSHFGGAGTFDHPFLSRQAQLCPNRNGMMQNHSGFVEDVESSAASNGRKVLTLFPTADD